MTDQQSRSYLKSVVVTRATGNDCDEGESCNKHSSTCQDEQQMRGG